MITIGIDPVIFSVGHVAIRWYSLIVATAVGIGVWVASRQARRKGISEQDFSSAVFWVVIAGLIGARALHVIDHWPHEYAANPIRVLYIWEGGLAIWGVVIGGFAALSVFAWRHSLAIGKVADIAAPGLVLGQALGRAACIITGDAMGKPTTYDRSIRFRLYQSECNGAAIGRFLHAHTCVRNDPEPGNLCRTLAAAETESTPGSDFPCLSSAILYRALRHLLLEFVPDRCLRVEPSTTDQPGRFSGRVASAGLFEPQTPRCSCGTSPLKSAIF